MHRILASFLCLIALGADAAPAPYDIVIRNGQIVDGSGNPWFHGDVAVQGDRIVAVGRIPAGPTKREIDAKGLVVAPGFIDIHSHSDFVLFEDGDAQSKIRQGVTTDVLGEGNSPGPFLNQLSPREVKIKGETVSLKTMKDYFDAIDKAGVSINVASYVGLGQVWECVMGRSHRRPTSEEFAEMKKLVAQAMQDGAFGLSSMMMMPPGSLATADEVVELCRVVRDHGGLFSSHIRNEGLGVFDSVRETISIGERAGVPVDIIHLKIADQKFWQRMPEVVALIESARQRGVNVQANVYPYTRGNNDLASIMPPWAHEGGPQKLVERLKDPSLRTKLKHDIEAGIEGWYNHYTAVGRDWSRMLVSANNRYRGLTMDRVIAQRSEGRTPPPDPLDVLIEILIEERGSVSTVYAHHTEEDMNVALKQPWCSVGSDGSAFATSGPLRRGNPHPRNFGTFPRVLGVYVRELRLLTLEEAVRKMTSFNAAKLGLHDRGRLQAGAFADITLFAPDRVLDKATYTDPFQDNVGIEYVIVNGTVVLDHDRHTAARPGRALRHQP